MADVKISALPVGTFATTSDLVPVVQSGTTKSVTVGQIHSAFTVTASKALVSNVSGNVTASSVTATELGYLSGVTSAIQTQFAGKQPLFSATAGSIFFSGGTSVVSQDNTRLKWDSTNQVLKLNDSATSPSSYFCVDSFVSGPNNTVGIAATILPKRTTILGAQIVSHGHLNNIFGAKIFESGVTKQNVGNLVTSFGIGNKFTKNIGGVYEATRSGVDITLSSIYGDISGTDFFYAGYILYVADSTLTQFQKITGDYVGESGGPTFTASFDGTNTIVNIPFLSPPAWTVAFIISGDGGTCAGSFNQFGGRGSVALGYMNYAPGEGSVAIGSRNISTTAGAITLGTLCTAAQYGFAVGYNNVASGNVSKATGSVCSADGTGSYAGGASSLTGEMATSTIVYGTSCQGNGPYSLIVGNGCIGGGEACFSGGTASNGNSDYCFVWNAPAGAGAGSFMITDGPQNVTEGGGKKLYIGNQNAFFGARFANGFIFASGRGSSITDTLGANFYYKQSSVDTADDTPTTIQTLYFPGPQGTGSGPGVDNVSIVRTTITALRSSGDSGAQGDSVVWEFQYRVKCLADGTVTVSGLTTNYVDGDAGPLGAWSTPTFTPDTYAVVIAVAGDTDYNITWWQESRVICNNNINND